MPSHNSKDADGDENDTSDGHKHTDNSIKHQTQRSIPGGWELSEDEDSDEDESRDQKSEPPTGDNLETSDSAKHQAELSVPVA
jgi:hypothetical protein